MVEKSPSADRPIGNIARSELIDEDRPALWRASAIGAAVKESVMNKRRKRHASLIALGSAHPNE